MAEMKIILQPKVAVHMSSFLDDLERHTIIAALYHSSLLDQVLETDTMHLSDDTIALCKFASLQARKVRRQVMEIRSRHNQTLRDDEEPKPWDFFTMPYIQRCVLLLRLAPVCLPIRSGGRSPSKALDRFRGAVAKVASARSPLAKKKSESAWDTMLFSTLHTHRVYRYLLLKSYFQMHLLYSCSKSIQFINLNFQEADNFENIFAGVCRVACSMSVRRIEHTNIYVPSAGLFLTSTLTLRY